jgi:hypothetical protein
MNLCADEPETVGVQVEKTRAPVGRLSPAQVGLLLRFAIEQHLQVAGSRTLLH